MLLRLELFDPTGQEDCGNRQVVRCYLLAGRDQRLPPAADVSVGTEVGIEAAHSAALAGVEPAPLPWRKKKKARKRASAARRKKTA